MQHTVSASKVAGLLGPAAWAHPAYGALADRLRRAITDGRLAAGSRMPSERELTGVLALSRTTVTRAYAELREQGYLVTRRGSGSIVQLPDVPGGRIDHLLAPAGIREDELDLTCTAPLGPPGLMEAYAAALTQVEAYLPGTGYYPSGLPVLRELVAARYTERGLATDPDQVLITSGALAGVAIAVRALAGRGERVLLEGPTYPNVIGTLEGPQARTVVYPLEHGPAGHSWDTETLARLVRQARPGAAYLIPDFHNPTGALMPAAQRAEVGAMLRRAHVVPIIDESLVDLFLDAEGMPPPLATSVPDAVSVGSASKTFWGGLRIGWMRVPRFRLEQMATSRLRLDLGAPVLEQLVVAELMRGSDGLLALQRRRLARARDTLAAGVREHLPDWSFTLPRGGLALWCRLPEPRSTALARAASRCGLVVPSGPTFAPAGGMDSWVRLPYTLAESRLAQVGPLLAQAWEQALVDDLPDGGGRRRIIA